MSIKNMNDLVTKAKLHDKNALLNIIDILKPYVIKNSKLIFVKGYDMDDLIQYGIISIIKSVQNYDIQKNSSFIPYATRAIKNNYYYLIRKACKTNFEASLNKENDEGFELIDIYADTINIEEEIIKKENAKKLIMALSNLKNEDKDILITVFYKNISLKAYAEKHMLKYITCVKRKKRAIINLKKEFDKL